VPIPIILIETMPRTFREKPLRKERTHLAQHLIAHYKTGVHLEVAILSFIRSTFGTERIAELERLLDDDDESQRETLMVLLFSPDSFLQLAVEPLLFQARFTKDDQVALAAQLAAALPTVAIEVPDQQGRLTLPAPAWAWRQLVEGLNITWKMPASVARAIATHIPDSSKNKVRVVLRNISFSSNREGIDACARLMAAYRQFDAHFEIYLDFFGNFLGQLSTGDNVHTALMKTRRHYQRGYHQAQRFETLRTTHNIETLMLQGITAPAMGTDQARRMMIMIDNIAFALYGQIAPFEEDLYR
jgi:hypothetical protein